MVLRLVDLHGGTVSATSAGPGAGSEFTVRLPAAAEPLGNDGQAAGLVPDGAAGRGGGRRILVVDDNRTATVMLADLLTLDEFAVRTAFDGHEALAAGEAFRPHAVVMDLAMPGLDGFAAAAQMWERPWGRSTTLIALSGWAQHKDRQRAEAAGFDSHLTKPVDSMALLDLLAAL